MQHSAECFQELTQREDLMMQTRHLGRSNLEGSASPTTAMTHIAIAELLDGMAVDWLEKVSDEQYGA